MSLEQDKDGSLLSFQAVAVLPRLGLGWEGARWSLGGSPRSSQVKHGDKCWEVDAT